MNFYERMDDFIPAIRLATERGLYHALTGRDPTPQLDWSVEVLDVSRYLLAWQSVNHDELTDPGIAVFWQYLHVGSVN